MERSASVTGPPHRLSRRQALRFAGLAVPALTLPGLLSACAGSADAAASAGVLRLTQPAEVKTLDPHKQGDMVSMNALINMFDTLTTRDQDNRLAPRLALSWSNPDPLTWRFQLRPGVRFHNGEPCDAAAVKYSIERLLDPATKSPIVELRYVTGAVVVDPLTVELHTNQPDPILPAKVSLFGGVVVPPKYIADVGDAGFARAPVGTGPFTFVSWQRDQELRMRANREHWNGPPDLRELVFRAMANPASALAALQSDEVDLVTGLTPDAALQLQGFPGVTIDRFPGIRAYYLSLDTEDAVLADPRVRQALNHAVDVPLLIDAVLDGKAREMPTMIPRESFGFDPTVTPFTRDLDLARRLLADAGHPDGFDTVLTASSVDAVVAEAISGLLARVNVRSRVETLDSGTYSTRLTSDNRRALGPIYLAASTGWTLDGQSNVQSNVRRDRRQSRWTSDEADRLIDGEELSVDPAERQRAFNDLQRLLKEEAPFVYLYQLDTLMARNARPSWRPAVTGSLAMGTAQVTA
jgi:peptide/nickel transport system substrate-binding protein